ncbi:L-rhamnose isomerase [Halosquirtibacter laminarini]|uniref:L-rhamnose isomerase n=1 Tax=Halosquirtibacter laminarini TaxID=3374600 RepID=A0AC61NED7_9BACT|nr:L-rhamnose isomerase [Prolixibacteraceae bacterium]
MTTKNMILEAYELANKQYAELGVDTNEAIEKLDKLVISLHCWQTDDVSGTENPEGTLSGGIQATGNYPGKARNISEIMTDLEKVMSLLPGKQRINVHALYGDFSEERVDRDSITIKQFQHWVDWCKKLEIGMDFNGSFFSHPNADSGFTLSSKDERIRKFWVEHLKRTRDIANEIGKQLGSPCILNTWIPDGSKDTPIDRNGMRAQLTKSLDEGFKTEYPKKHMKDAVESKVFGIGAESMTVGSHDYYLGYAIKNNKMICLDNGHFHPTEIVGDKISSCLQFVDEVLLHVTRPVRWDSDHVVTLNDETQLIASEIVRNDFMHRINVGLDFFDASINRIGAYVVGTRAVQKAFLIALLEPTNKLVELEENGKNFERLAMLEELKSKPFGAIWDYYCMINDVPIGENYIKDIQQYEEDVLKKR